MKVLVTGATGSVGSHIVEQLVAKNIEVKAFLITQSEQSDEKFIK
ncbi:NAD-dependent epimerase/dehydratase family protein [Paenibacillus polymyxa]|nr:NAD-dependent epimerase/dehydratase family protein [Paenibacillus polymyxa]URJ62504.1 NAD-dependent epimerase/dehydratase family protein [Paenibacillus polymyxa]